MYDLAAIVKQIGPRRVMFGSDIPLNMASELAKYRSLGLSESDLEWCLARTVGGLPHRLTGRGRGRRRGGRLPQVGSRKRRPAPPRPSS